MATAKRSAELKTLFKHHKLVTLGVKGCFHLQTPRFRSKSALVFENSALWYEYQNDKSLGENQTLSSDHLEKSDLFISCAYNYLAFQVTPCSLLSLYFSGPNNKP